MRENELEQRRIEAAKILTVLKQQEEKLNNIIQSQHLNTEQMENLYTLNTLDIQQIESHRSYGLKLTIDEKISKRLIANTTAILEKTN